MNEKCMNMCSTVLFGLSRLFVMESLIYLSVCMFVQLPAGLKVCIAYVFNIGHHQYQPCKTSKGAKCALNL